MYFTVSQKIKWGSEEQQEGKKNAARIQCLTYGE